MRGLPFCPDSWGFGGRRAQRVWGRSSCAPGPSWVAGPDELRLLCPCLPACVSFLFSHVDSLPGGLPGLSRWLSLRVTGPPAGCTHCDSWSVLLAPNCGETPGCSGRDQGGLRPCPHPRRSTCPQPWAVPSVVSSLYGQGGL